MLEISQKRILIHGDVMYDEPPTQSVSQTSPLQITILALQLGHFLGVIRVADDHPFYAYPSYP